MKLHAGNGQKNEYLVLVANAGRARYFAREKRFSELREVGDRVHPESRMQGRDLERDAPGQASRPAPNVPEDSLSEASTPKKKEAEKFAHLLAADLKQARTDNVFAHLTLVAAPNFLGLLRQNLDEQTGKMVAQEIPKNVTTETVANIQAAIDSESD